MSCGEIGSGVPGGSTPDYTEQERIPYKDSGTFQDSPLFFDVSENKVVSDVTLEVPGGTIEIGETTAISACSESMIITQELTDNSFYSAVSLFDATGSLLPVYPDLGPEFTLNIQTDFSQTLTANPLTYSITGTVTSPDKRQLRQTTFKTGGVMTNVRAKFTDNATGIVVRYIPDKAIYTAGTGGMTLVSGDNVFDFISTAADTPGVFNLGVNPFWLSNGQQIDIEILADSVNILGDLSGDPYQTAQVQDGPIVSLSDKESVDRVQTTGLLEGGLISIATSTTVDWTSGRGIVTNFSDPEDVIPTDVTWDAVTGQSVTNIATDGTTLFGYDSAGSIVQKLSTAVSIADSHDTIFFGSATHIGGSLVAVITAPGNMAFDGLGSYSDFINLVIGPANIDGNIYGANGSNMNIDVVGGNAYMIGSNFRNDPTISDIVTLSNDTTISFQKVYKTAGAGLSVVYDGVPTTTIDPSSYDDGSGTLATTTAGYWTIQRIYRSRTGSTLVAYGQEEFASKSNALTSLGKEVFVEKSPLPFTLFRSSLVIQQGATDLSNTAQAEFFVQSSFRLVGAQSASATIPGVTNPGGSDGNIQYNSSSTFGGDSNFAYDDTLKTVSLEAPAAGSATYEFINSSDVVKGVIKYAETADEFSIAATGTTSVVHLNDVGFVHKGNIDGRFDVQAVTAAGCALLTLSQGGGGTGLSIEHDDASDESSIISQIGDLNIGADASGANIVISPDGGTGFKKNPATNYVFDIYAVSPNIVGLYSAKAVTLETGTYGDSESINLIFNKGDVGTDQSEFVLFNNNHSTESTRYFRMGYADEIATQGGLNISDANNFVSIGTRTDPDSPLHVYQNDTETGDQCGITIEQGSTGDAVLQYLLTGGQRWVMGLSNAGGDAFEIASSINLGSDTRFIINTTGEVKITDSLMIGSSSNPASPLHIYQNDTLTGADSGITLEQDSTGDAVLHYVLTGIQTISTGVDYSGSGHYKISGSADLGTDTILTATIAGKVGVGDNDPVSTLHVYDDTTTVGSSIGLTIEQDGTGDALAQWQLTGGVRYLAGIDNSDSDLFKLEYGGFLSTDAAIQINTDNELGIGGAPVADFAANVNGKLIVQEHTEFDTSNSPYGGRGQVQNRLAYSQEFDNAVWVPGGTDAPVITENNALAPDGTMTADTISFAGPGAGLIRQSMLGLIEDDTYNVTGWVRHVSGGTQLTARLDTDNIAAWIATSEWKRFDSDIVQGAGGAWFDLFAFAAHTPAVFEVWGLQISDGAGSKPYLKTAETPLLVATTGATVNNSLYIKDAREVATTGPEVVEIWTLDDFPRVGGTGDVIPEYKLYRFMQEIDWGTTRLKLENDAYALFEGYDVFVTSQTYSGTDPWVYGEGTIRCVGNGMTWKITSDNSTMFDITAGGWGMDYSTIMTTGDNCSLGTITAPSVTNPLLGARFISTRSLFQGFKTGLTLVNPGNIHIDISFFYDSTDAVGPMLSVIGMGKAGVIESTEVTMASATSDFLYVSPITEAPVTCMNVTLADGQSFFTSGDTGAITLFADASVPAEAVTSVTDNAGTARFNFAAPPTLYVGQKVVMSTFTNYDNVTATITATGAGYYETGVDYNGADTGSFLSDSVTVTSAGHGLSELDDVLITATMEYNHGSTIYNVQTNTFQVNSEWHTAETSGTWDDGSLDHTGKYVHSFNNGAQQDSHAAPSFNVEDNAETTTTTTSWGSITFGTVGSAIVTGASNENFTLLDELTGLTRYEGLDPLTIKMNPSISMIKSGGAVEHQFRLFKTTGSPAFDPHTVKRSISTVAGAAALNCSAVLNPGDEFIPQIKATTTGSTITITDFSL